MRFMHWSYCDLCECPQFYKDVLIDMIEEDGKESEHRNVLATARAMKRR